MIHGIGPGPSEKNTTKLNVPIMAKILAASTLLSMYHKKIYIHNRLPLLNPIPPRLFSNLFPLGGGRHVSHPVELHTKIFLHQNFSLSGLRVSIADFGFEGPGFDSQ